MNKWKKRAFTLIELLIVIAIIGILFIVLVSKVDFATDKAKATGVQTDFRSFQMAFETVARENAGFASLGWDTGDANGNRKRDSYDEGDTNTNNIMESTEIWTGHKVYGENWTGTYILVNPDDNTDKSAFELLEDKVNANLDPKLHITITPEENAGVLTGNATVTMANGAQDPWKNEYHGAYITNAQNDKGDRGAFIIYSNGANGQWGSEHDIANGKVSIIVPNNNVYGKDDYAMSVFYTYANGYGEVTTITGTPNKPLTIVPGQDSGSDDVLPSPEPSVINGLTINKPYKVSTSDGDIYVVFTSDTSVEIFVDIEGFYGLPWAMLPVIDSGKSPSTTTYRFENETTLIITATGQPDDIILKFDKTNNQLIFDDYITLTLSNDKYSPGYYNTIYYSYMANIPDIKQIEGQGFVDLNGEKLTDVNAEIIEHILYINGMPLGWITMNGEDIFLDGKLVLSTTRPENKNPTQHLVPGLYQTGSNYQTMLKDWDQLIDEGILTVKDGMVYTCQLQGNSFSGNPYVDALAGELVLPQDGSVTRIGDGQQTVPNAYIGFWGCDNLTKVILPGTITHIDPMAFFYCRGLTSIGCIGSGASIEIPYSVTSIGAGAFNACINITNIDLELTRVTSIGNGAFMYCGSADMISLPSNLSYIGRSAFSGVNAYNSYDCSFNLNLSNKYIYENGCLIDKSEGVLLWANGNVTIPEETWLTTIGQDAFCETKMTSIIIPANIKVIEDSAFYEAFNLTNITFLGNEIAIGKSAFFRTNSLTSITLSGKVSIGATAFDSSGLETITINNTNSLVIEEGTFSRCNNLHTVNITGDITSIGDNAFNTDSTSLTISFSDNTPATLNGSRIFNTANTAIYVPNEQAYKAAWSAYSQIIFSE